MLRWITLAAGAFRPEVRDRIQSMGADVIGSPPDKFAAFMRAETAKWAKIVKEANIRAE